MWRHWKRLGVSVCGSMVLCIWSLPTGYFFVQSLRKKRVESGLAPFSRLNAKARLFGRAFFLSIFIISSWVELKCQIGWIYFWLAGCSFGVGYGFLAVGLSRSGA